MIAVVLAAFSAASYGAADFSGAVASKEHDSTLITVAMHAVSLVALSVVVVAITGGTFTSADLAWGALGGLGAAYGQTTFFKALALGPMSTAAAITAVSSAALPVVAGLALGDRPGVVTLLGVGLALPGAVLVSIGGSDLAIGSVLLPPRERVVELRHTTRTRLLSLSAGCGFGLFFVALAQTSAESGLVPLLSARVASITALAAALSFTVAWEPIGRKWWPFVVLSGLLDSAANGLYLFALQFGSLSWVAAVSSLYPVSTVLLARLFLAERLTRTQVFGTAFAGAALVLIGVGSEL